ncbi:MAG: hypothetical protein JOZ73_09930 [Solirubrobacterales bacterium]|nr:hypothetical protein [Solirubrobacterales bacterium]
MILASTDGLPWCPPHSETVAAGSRMRPRPRMQGWPISVPIHHTLLLHAYCSHDGAVAASCSDRQPAAGGEGGS